MCTKLKNLMGMMFAIIFILLSLLLIVLSAYQFYSGWIAGKELITIFVQSINTVIISLAIFELGIGIGKEYVITEEEKNAYFVVRRTITRFVGIVCIALVLESLIMIIKYSQLEMAGNLNYPVSILVGASLLLTGLGLFLHLTREDCRFQTERNRQRKQSPVTDFEVRRNFKPRETRGELFRF